MYFVCEKVRGCEKAKAMRKKPFWPRPGHRNRSFVGFMEWTVKIAAIGMLFVFLFFLLFKANISGHFYEFRSGKTNGLPAENPCRQIHSGKTLPTTPLAAKKPRHHLVNGSQNSTPINSLNLEFPLDCGKWNLTQICPRNYPQFHKPSSNSSAGSTCPDYFRWIHHDLRHWRETGITEGMVEKARETAHFRLTILGGKMYVEPFRDSIQTRAMFTVWGIGQLMRRYPGKLPDLELMFDCDDRPVVPSDMYREVGSEPPPLFRYCSDRQSMDIVFPDWSFWGWAETNIRPWRSVLKDIKVGNSRIKWEGRVPYAYWKGNPDVAPWRGELMQCNVTDQNDWNSRLYVQNWVQESEIGYKHSNIEDQCTHRYKIYVEGWAWSVSEKYILACDSPTLLMSLRWHDFFIRGMVPLRHYWPVRDEDKCRSLKFAVEWGNNHPEEAKAIGKAGSCFIHEDLKMEYVYDYMFHLLNEYAKLLNYKPSIPPNAVEFCSERMACPTDGNWRKFMEESFEISPSNSIPCTIPPPYTPQEFETLAGKNSRAVIKVKKWEKEYWDRQNKKQQSSL